MWPETAERNQRLSYTRKSTSPEVFASFYFLDDVYTRVADLEEDTSIFGSDLFYHKKCLENYLREYEIVTSERQQSEKAPKKYCLFL